MDWKDVEVHLQASIIIQKVLTPYTNYQNHIDMKTEKTFIRSSYDDLDISIIICRPESSPKAVIQLVHGMCEHKERYIPFMEFLCNNGYACIIHDHRGHGASVKSPDDLGYMYTGGWKGVTDDVRTVNRYASELFKGSRILLFGHSMGSLAVRSFAKRHDDLIDGLMVCGSPSRNPAAGAGKMLAKLIAALKGDRHRPGMIQKIAFESFNSRFVNEGHNAWLSTDKAIVEEYNNNPLCTYQFTCNGFISLFCLMQDTYSAEEWTVSKPGLPVHFIAGADDPCITSLKDFNEAVNHMKAVGYRNVTSRTYEGMRHEILNETRKEEVWKDALNTFDSWIGA